MNQANFKLHFASALLATTVFVVPILTLAADRPNVEETGKRATQKIQIDFCAKFTTSQAKMLERLAQKERSLLDRREERTDKTLNRKENLDARMDDHRDKADETRARQFARLEAGATTDAEKTAADTYQKIITDSISKRRIAVDAAMKTFRENVNAATLSHKNAIDTALTKLKTSTKSAVDKAKADCTAEKYATTVRQEFQTAMENSRKAFRTDRAAVPKISKQIEALAKTRREAIKKAMDEFKLTAEKAKANLKLAFGK